MDELRWALLLLGGIVILAVYLYTRKQSSSTGEVDGTDGATSGVRGESLWADDETPVRTDPAVTSGAARRMRQAEAPGSGRKEPRLDATFAEDDQPEEPLPFIGDERAEAEAPVARDVTPDPGPPIDPDKIVAMRMSAKSGQSFSAEEIVLKLRELGLRHGKFSIFHLHAGVGQGSPLFSVASMTEPGSFDLTKLRETRLPGVTLFMVLPGPADPVETFDRMVEVARTLARDLEGELLDESASTWSIQRERYVREELIRYRLQHPRRG